MAREETGRTNSGRVEDRSFPEAITLETFGQTCSLSPEHFQKDLEGFSPEAMRAIAEQLKVESDKRMHEKIAWILHCGEQRDNEDSSGNETVQMPAVWMQVKRAGTD